MFQNRFEEFQFETMKTEIELLMNKRPDRSAPAPN